MKIVAFVPDLMDKSRFANVEPKPTFVAAPQQLAEAEEGDIVVVDMSRPGVIDVISGLEGVRRVGFISHESRDVIAEAKTAGIETYPRSRFFSRIVDILAKEAD